MRINVGVPPKYLCDNHLIAEHVEITFVPGILRSNGNRVLSVPGTFSLGKGHVNFFKNKLTYLHNRLSLIIEEMKVRGFNYSSSIDPQIYPVELQLDWKPTMEESLIIRNRIEQKMLAKTMPFWRYSRKYVDDVNGFIYNLKHSELSVY